MRKYFDSILSADGKAVVGASVTVALFGSTTPTSIFSDSAGLVPRANPLTTDANGFFEFYAADGRYTLIVSATGFGTRTVTDILLEDPADASQAAINGGSINNTPIGATTPNSGAFTTLSASGGITGALTGNVTGNVTGDLTGNVTGNVTGGVTGNVTGNASTATTATNQSGGTVNATSVTTPTVTNAGTLALAATGTNVVTVSTNGAERARFDATGKFGISTNNPYSRLDVYTNTADELTSVFTTGVSDVNFRVGFGNGQAGSSGTEQGKVGLFYLGNGEAATVSFVRGGGATDASIAFRTNGVERARIDELGNTIQRVNNTAATLTVNQTLTFSIVDDSTLRISVRGSDGTTRTATVALT
jgi:hypothetical protein